jgi:hypothetical protein
LDDPHLIHGSADLNILSYIAQLPSGIHCALGRTLGGIPVAQDPTDWQNLAERASIETDPKKMLHLVEELNRVLDAQRKTKIVLRES